MLGKSKRRRRSGKRHRVKKIPAAPKISIEHLPEDSKARLTIGNFELDAIVGKKGRSVLQMLVDRKARRCFINKVPSLKSKVYANTLVNRIKAEQFPTGTVKTILQDNGVEHAEHSWVDRELDCQSYFTHPYCASERGTVENRNRVPRIFLPKGTDFDDIPDDFIQWIEDQMNHRPMKILGFKTPMQVWNEEIAKI